MQTIAICGARDTVLISVAPVRESKKTFEVWFWRVFLWNACFDGGSHFEVAAISKKEALKQLREECGDSALVQFVQAKKEAVR